MFVAHEISFHCHDCLQFPNCNKLWFNIIGNETIKLKKSDPPPTVGGFHKTFFLLSLDPVGN